MTAKTEVDDREGRARRERALKAKPRGKARVVLIAAISAVATAFTGIVIVNLTSGEQAIDKPIPSLFGIDDPEFSRTMTALGGAPLVAGNDVTPLYNGQQIFKAMLDDIGRAKRTVTFETYIYWSGKVGAAFTKVLVERARAAVKIHLIIDAVGSGKMDHSQLQQMRDAGVEIEKYHPLRWYNFDRINNRTHRKLLVIDGRVGFTGGVGIADKWDGNGDDPDHWRDTHFRLAGPAVAQMQATFVEHWLTTKGVLLQGPDYFPELESAGTMPAQMVSSAVDDGRESLRLMYLLSIASARHSLLLANSYFVPDGVAVRSLVEARRRGVDVEIIVPGPDIDSEVTRAASRHRWAPLLEAGVAIFEFQPTMFHCKVMVVDDLWVSVGSTNFDGRSFRLNAEANLNVLDRGLALQERRAFEKDRLNARRITIEEWHHRPLLDRVGDWFASLIGAQL